MSSKKEEDDGDDEEYVTLVSGCHVINVHNAHAPSWKENARTLKHALYFAIIRTRFRRVHISQSLCVCAFTLPFLILFTTLLFTIARNITHLNECCCRKLRHLLSFRMYATTHITSFNEHWTWHRHNNNTLYAANKIYYICRIAAMNGSSSSSSSSSCIHVCARLHVHVHLLWLYNNLVSLRIESSMYSDRVRDESLHRLLIHFSAFFIVIFLFNSKRAVMHCRVGKRETKRKAKRSRAQSCNVYVSRENAKHSRIETL